MEYSWPVIHQIPPSEEQEDMYKPLKLLIGPYHNPNWIHEKHLAEDDAQLSQPSICDLKGCRMELDQRVEKVKAVYSEFKTEGITNGRLRDRMIADACYLWFMLTFTAGTMAKKSQETIVGELRLSGIMELMNSNVGKAFEFKADDVRIYRRDMLLYPNQIPCQLFFHLNSWNLVALTKNLCDVYTLPQPHFSLVFKCLHILDFYRYVFLYGTFGSKIQNKFFQKCETVISIGQNQSMANKYDPNDDPFLIPSATELVESGIGIQIKKSWLMDISLTGNSFDIPRLDLPNGEMEFITHNIIMFERSDPSAGTPFSSYIYFMDKLIPKYEDVKLLMIRGIINPTLHGDKVVELIRRVSKNIEFNDKLQMDAELFNTGKMLRNRYNRNCEPWRKDLFQTYLRTPWAVISICGAFLILSLTLIQTVYTVLGYYKKS